MLLNSLKDQKLVKLGSSLSSNDYTIKTLEVGGMTFILIIVCAYIIIMLHIINLYYFQIKTNYNYNKWILTINLVSQNNFIVHLKELFITVIVFFVIINCCPFK